MQARDEIGMATQVEAKGVNMVREEGRSEASLRGSCTTQGRSSEVKRGQAKRSKAEGGHKSRDTKLGSSRITNEQQPLVLF